MSPQESCHCEFPSHRGNGKEESLLLPLIWYHEIYLLIYLNMVTVYLLRLPLGNANTRSRIKLIDLTVEAKNMTQNAGQKANWFE